MHRLETVSGIMVPPVGLGTYPFQGDKIKNIVLEACKCGYRLIDTADDYHGETGIGLAISSLKDKTGLTREDIFLQTKISQDNAFSDEPLEGIWFNSYSKYQKRHSVEEVVRDKVSISLREMRTDYIDSLLIHYPFPDFYEEIWSVMMDLQKEGKIRYIGVSNFHIRHIERLKSLGDVPAINQIYMSPISLKEEDSVYAQRERIQLMTYSPLVDAVAGRLNNEILQSLAKKYRKSVSQIILRWNIERESIPLPRTGNLQRLKENIEVMDFCLSEVEVASISSMNKNHQYLIESKQCPGI